MDSNKRQGDSIEEQTKQDQQENQTSDLARMLAERAARILSEDQPLPVDRLRAKPASKPPESPAGQAAAGKSGADKPAVSKQPEAKTSIKPDLGGTAQPQEKASGSVAPGEPAQSKPPAPLESGENKPGETSQSPGRETPKSVAETAGEPEAGAPPALREPEQPDGQARDTSELGRPSNQPEASVKETKTPAKQAESKKDAPPQKPQAQNQASCTAQPVTPDGGEAPPANPDGKPEADPSAQDDSGAKPKAQDAQTVSPQPGAQEARRRAAVSVSQAHLDAGEPEDGADEIPEGTKTVMAVYDLVQVFAQALFIITLLFAFVFRIAAVNGYSMEPTLDDGNWVVVSNFGFEVKRGEIVVISQPNMLNEPLIKRIIAVGGETIDIDEEGNVTIDGQVIDEPYIAEITRARGDIALPHTVPEGYVFVMGDNRNKSGDSRYSYIGDIDERYLVGEAKLRLFPIGKHTIENRSVEYSIDTQNDGASS